MQILPTIQLFAGWNFSKKNPCTVTCHGFFRTVTCHGPRIFRDFFFYKNIVILQPNHMGDG